MKKINLISLLLILSAVCIAAGCKNVKQDMLIDYINNDIPRLAQAESKVYDKWTSVSGEYYTDDSDMYNALVDTILTDSLHLMDTAKAVSTDDKEIRKMHEIYISAVNTQHSAFEIIVSALENQDAAQISEANEKLSEARRLMREWQTRLDELKAAKNVIQSND